MRIALPLLALACLGADSPTSIGIDLDGDGRVDRVAVDGSGSLSVVGADGRCWGSVTAIEPPVGEPIIRIVHSGADQYIHVRWLGTGEKGALETIALIEGTSLRPVFSGRTGPTGRDSEWADRVRVDGDGVLRYQTAPGVARCDGFNILFPKLYDPRQARFRSVTLAPPVGAPLSALSSLPSLAIAKPLGLFRFVAASTMRGDGGRADRLAAPTEVDDARIDTQWIEGMAGFGRGAFITARSRTPGRMVVGIKLTRPSLRGFNRLLRIALLVGEERFSVDLPPTEQAWIALPSPVAADCVTIALAEAMPFDSGDTAIAEAAIYTDLDGPDGSLSIARMIARGEPGADALLDVLVRQGPSAVPAIRTALPEAIGGARRKLLGEAIAVGGPDAAELLARALAIGDDDERRFIDRALQRDATAGRGTDSALGKLALTTLLTLAHDRSMPIQARADAIRIAGRWASGPSMQDLFALASSGEPPLREALSALATTGPISELLPLVSDALVEIGPPGDHAAKLAERLASRVTGDGAAQLSNAIALGWSSKSPSFARSFRLLRATKQLHSPRLLAMLEEAHSDRNELIRWAAVEAAAGIADPRAQVIVAASLTDGDPRVHGAALEALDARSSVEANSAELHALSGDLWPDVRRLAAELLGRHPCSDAAAAGLERSTLGETERSGEVRGAAFDALDRCAPQHAAALAIHLLGDGNGQNVPPSLRAQSAALAAKLQLSVAVPSMVAALDALLAPTVADPRVGLGETLARALGHFNRDERAEAALIRATRAAAPPIRAAAIEALATRTDRGARAAISTAVADADPSVRRAATAARARWLTDEK